VRESDAEMQRQKRKERQGTRKRCEGKRCRDAETEKKREKMRKRERKRKGETDKWDRQRIERNKTVRNMELGDIAIGEGREIVRKRKERKFMHRR
jgi:hypothetical protein